MSELEDLYGPLDEKKKKRKKRKKAGSESSKESSLRDWFGRKGAKGKKKGWVDCNAPDGKGGYKSCGRSGKEKRKKYPACRPTPGACKERGKGKSWGKKAKRKSRKNEELYMDLEQIIIEELENVLNEAAYEAGRAVADIDTGEEYMSPENLENEQEFEDLADVFGRKFGIELTTKMENGTLIAKVTLKGGTHDGEVMHYSDPEDMYQDLAKYYEMSESILDEKRKKKQQKGKKRAAKKAKRKKKSGKKDACYHKVKSRYKVWPSAYASGALVKCRNVGAKNWGNSKKESIMIGFENQLVENELYERVETFLDESIYYGLIEEQDDVDPRYERREELISIIYDIMMDNRSGDEEEDFIAAKEELLDDEKATPEELSGIQLKDILQMSGPIGETIEEKKKRKKKKKKKKGCTPAKGKKYARRVKGRCVSYGAKGYSIAPGTSKGNSYCARSYGDMKSHGKDCSGKDRSTPLCLSRKKWKCSGKYSRKGK